MATRTKIVWSGPKILRRFLVPLDSLEPFPGNYRIGDTAAIAASLERFGQLKPIVTDGPRIVAGHHIVKAADRIGWSHVAAVSVEFANENEQRAFLLADNRTQELGGRDDQLLADLLQTLDDADALPGTGYDHDDLEDLLAEIAKRNEDDRVQVTFTARAKDGRKQLVLDYTDAQMAQVEIWLNMIGKETGAESPSDRVYEALRTAASALNLS